AAEPGRSVLEDVGPIGMLLAFGVDVGAERIDLEAFRARVLDEPADQRQRHAVAAQTIVDRGVLGDDERLARAAIGEFAFALMAREARYVAAARGALFAGNCEVGRGHRLLVAA